jgi:hypothetical protein
MTYDHPLFEKAPSHAVADEATSQISTSSSAIATSDTGRRGEPARTKVAQASKNAREKRKKEMETLVEENQRLREERERFLQHIEMLQEKVIEMREKEGDIDLQLENELLKAQLSEHTMFVNGLLRMAGGVPTTEAEKKQLYRQGADYAVAHINSLLSRSVRTAGEWRVAKVPEGMRNLAVWYQYVTDQGTGLRRLNLRADQVILGVSSEIVSALYWSLWTSETAVRELFEGSHVDSAEISSKAILHEELRCNPSQDDGEDKEESLATLYTRDDRAHHVFIASKREQSIARGSLALAMDGDDVGGQMIQPWKRRRCKMCARSNTNVNRLQEEGVPASLASAAATGLPMNNPTYIEGSVVWDLDDNRGCRLASVLSLVEGFKVGKFDAFELVTPDGWVSEKFLTFIRAFVVMLKAQYPILLQQMALARQGSTNSRSSAEDTSSTAKKRRTVDSLASSADDDSKKKAQDDL